MEITKLVKNYREAVARLDNLTDAECMNDELTDRLIDEEVSLQEQIIDVLVKITNGQIIRSIAEKMILREPQKTCDLLVKYEMALNY